MSKSAEILRRLNYDVTELVAQELGENLPLKYDDCKTICVIHGVKTRWSYVPRPKGSTDTVLLFEPKVGDTNIVKGVYLEYVSVEGKAVRLQR